MFFVIDVFFQVFINRLPAIEKEIKFEKQRSDRFSRLISTSDNMGNPLDGLLLLPVQRLPRYELLFKDLLKKTPKVT